MKALSRQQLSEHFLATAEQLAQHFPHNNVMQIHQALHTPTDVKYTTEHFASHQL